MKYLDERRRIDDVRRVADNFRIKPLEGIFRLRFTYIILFCSVITSFLISVIVNETYFFLRYFNISVKSIGKNDSIRRLTSVQIFTSMCNYYCS